MTFRIKMKYIKWSKKFELAKNSNLPVVRKIFAIDAVVLSNAIL